MKMGIIGAGMIVNDLFRFIHQVEGITLKGICARKGSEEKLEKCVRNREFPHGIQT